MEAATTAAPPISPLINPIPDDGFIDIPPVSKVTPAEREREREREREGEREREILDQR